MAIQRGGKSTRCGLDMRIVLAAVIMVIFAAACGDGGKKEVLTTEQLYSRKCSLCHGQDGKRMASGAPDLSLSSKTKDELIAIISLGKGNMPPQKDVLSKEEISELADYVLKFRNN